jgi:organic hydroperoxide reductase OsmC/OhrA
VSSHIATINWKRNPDAVFTDRKFSRAHTWRFDGGVEIPASSSPHAVPLPYSVEANVDPEEAFVASISSCHMLTFLFEAAKRGVVVDRYEDHAEGTMDRIAPGRYAVTRVVLHPNITYAGAIPDQATIDELHHAAHEGCFIANSVKTEIVVSPD